MPSFHFTRFTTDFGIPASKAAAMYAITRFSNMNKPKRKRRGSGGSSSSGSSSSSRKRRAQQDSKETAPSESSASIDAPASEDSSKTDDNGKSPDRTPPKSGSNTPPKSSPITPSPKARRRHHVKAVLRKFSAIGRKRGDFPTGVSNNSRASNSDTSIEEDSHLRRCRSSIIPEVTVTPSSDDDSANASPNASVRTMYRVDPRTGRPMVQKQHYNALHLSPRSAARRTRPTPATTAARRRSGSIPPFPVRDSSLRHSDEFPFDPTTAAACDDDSSIYATAPTSPIKQSQQSLTSSSHSNKNNGIPTNTTQSSSSTTSLHDKPLPALPPLRDDRPSPSSGTSTPTPLSPLLGAATAGSDTDSDDTPRAPVPAAQWPLPADRRSVYGPPASLAGEDDDVGSRGTITATTTTTTATSGSAGAGELAALGLRYVSPLDERVLAARLKRIRDAAASASAGGGVKAAAAAAADVLPAVPGTGSASAYSSQYQHQHQHQHQHQQNQQRAMMAVEGEEMGGWFAGASGSGRESFVSVLSTAASFVTAAEEVEGEGEVGGGGGDGGAEGAAEVDKDESLSSGQVAEAGLPTAEDKDGGKLRDSFDSFDGLDPTSNSLDLDNVPSMIEDEGEDMDDMSSTSADVDMRIPTEEDYKAIPFRVTTCGPPTLSTDLHEDILAFKYSPINCFWDPIWKLEPDVDNIATMIRPYARLCGLPHEDIGVKFLAKGAWNKVYTVFAVDKVTGATSECIFRCALPGYPWFRMQLEISTMEYVRTNTEIPVPKVYVFNSSMENPIGVEWLLMEKINGAPYIEAQASMSFEAKIKLHKTVADWVHQLSQLSFDKMGCVYRRWDLPITDKHAFVIGPMNDWEFTADIRLDLDFHRGPFTSLEQYVSSLISMRIAESADSRLKERVEYYEARRSAAQRLHEHNTDSDAVTTEMPPEDPAIELAANDSYSLEALAKIPKYGVALQSLLPSVCGNERFGPGSTYLYHDDIHAKNILVDTAGKPVALLDWEGVYACPHAWTDRYPRLIDPEDYDEPEPFDIVGPMTEVRAADEQAWQRTLLRNAYDERLGELGSPVLRERAVNEDLEAILVRVRNIETCYKDWRFVDEMKEKEVLDLLGVS